MVYFYVINLKIRLFYVKFSDFMDESNSKVIVMHVLDSENANKSGRVKSWLLIDSGSDGSIIN